MRTIRVLFAVGLLLSLLLLCSCATPTNPAVGSLGTSLRAETILNEDAGCGSAAIIVLRSEDGRELPFIVDTGAPMTVLDKSLEPGQGKCLGTHTLDNFGALYQGSVYAAPELYLGDTRLATDVNTIASDILSKVTADAGRPVLGILGMDCLRHYCIQFDFKAGKMRFLDSGRTEPKRLGKAFPLTFSSQGNDYVEWIRPYIHCSHLVGEGEIDLLIDTGHSDDGALEPGILRREVQARTLRPVPDPNDANEPRAACLAESVWNGERYRDLVLANGRNTRESDDGENSLGLRFLARHLVTFDFPHRTMYLKKTRTGPLVDKRRLAETKTAGRSAFRLARKMIKRGQLPGWQKDDPAMSEAMCRLRENPDRVTLDAHKKGDVSTYHYEFGRPNQDDSWTLQKAWRTDPNDQTVEEYSVP